MQELQKANSGRTLPAICDFDGFHSKLIHFDTLHVCYRGFGPDLTASILLDLFHQNGGFTEAHTLASAWAAAQGLELSCDEFALSSDEKFAFLQAKGADIKIICLWLVLKSN